MLHKTIFLGVHNMKKIFSFLFLSSLSIAVACSNSQDNDTFDVNVAPRVISREQNSPPLVESNPVELRLENIKFDQKQKARCYTGQERRSPVQLARDDKQMRNNGNQYN
jgi:hypothetical protein